MNIFKRGDIVRIRDEHIKDLHQFGGNFPNLKDIYGRIFSVNGDICTVLFKKARNGSNNSEIYDFHYTKLTNPKILRNRKIDLILND